MAHKFFGEIPQADVTDLTGDLNTIEQNISYKEDTIYMGTGEMLVGTSIPQLGKETLPAGTDGQLLTADTSVTTGMSWKSPDDHTHALVRSFANYNPVGQVTSTSYVTLTGGPEVTVSMAATGPALIIIASSLYQVGAANKVLASYAVSGATTISASDTVAVMHNGSGAAEQYSMTSVVTLNAGSNTIGMRFRVFGATGEFANRSIFVMAL